MVQGEALHYMGPEQKVINDAVIAWALFMGLMHSSLGGKKISIKKTNLPYSSYLCTLGSILFSD